MMNKMLCCFVLLMAMCYCCGGYLLSRHAENEVNKATSKMQLPEIIPKTGIFSTTLGTSMIENGSAGASAQYNWTKRETQLTTLKTPMIENGSTNASVHYNGTKIEAQPYSKGLQFPKRSSDPERFWRVYGPALGFVGVLQTICLVLTWRALKSKRPGREAQHLNQYNFYAWDPRVLWHSIV